MTEPCPPGEEMRRHARLVVSIDGNGAQTAFAPEYVALCRALLDQHAVLTAVRAHMDRCDEAWKAGHRALALAEHAQAHARSQEPPMTGRSTSRSTGGQMSGDYQIEPHPPLVTQVCQRCGALVGSAVLHDAWHDIVPLIGEDRSKRPPMPPPPVPQPWKGHGGGDGDDNSPSVEP